MTRPQGRNNRQRRYPQTRPRGAFIARFRAHLENSRTVWFVRKKERKQEYKALYDSVCVLRGLVKPLASAAPRRVDQDSDDEVLTLLPDIESKLSI